MSANVKCLKLYQGASPQLSVLVRVKNEMRAIAEFYRRLCTQTLFPVIEPVFLDSGSTDGTLEFLEQLPVSLYQQPAQDFQFGRSCNLLISLSNAPMVCLLSGHVLLTEDAALERALGALAPHPGSAGYFRQVPNLLWGATYYEQAYLRRRYPRTPQAIVELDHPAAFSNAASMLTRAAWHRNPFPEIDASEDFIWAQRQLACSGKLFYLAGISVMHSHLETPQQVMHRVRLNAKARGLKGSYLRYVYYELGIMAGMLAQGASLKEAGSYAHAHARAYLPSQLSAIC